MFWVKGYNKRSVAPFPSLATKGITRASQRFRSSWPPQIRGSGDHCRESRESATTFRQDQRHRGYGRPGARRQADGGNQRFCRAFSRFRGYHGILDGDLRTRSDDRESGAADPKTQGTSDGPQGGP